LAQVDYDGLSGWRVTAAGGRSPSTFDFLTDSEPAPAVIDERQYPWIGSGRYAVRRAHGGSAQPPTEEPWALVVDNSASMRAIFDEASLEESVSLVAGVLSEFTGRLPMTAGVSGRSRPEWVTTAAADPAALVPEVLSATQPASWCLILPALTEATASGARRVALLLDGPPSDLENLAGFLAERPGVVVTIVVAARPSAEVAGGGAEESSVLMSFDQVARLPQLQVAYLPVGTGPLTDGTATELAFALVGESA
jgi:hypothetical protein